MQNSEFGTMLLGSVMKIFGIWYNAKSQCYGWSSYVYCILYDDMKRFIIWFKAKSQWYGCYEKIICSEPNITKNTNTLYVIMKRSSTLNQILQKIQIYCMQLWKDHLKWQTWYIIQNIVAWSYREYMTPYMYIYYTTWLLTQKWLLDIKLEDLLCLS